jgi:hypothetical protein
MKIFYLIWCVLAYGLSSFAICLIFHHRPFLSNAMESIFLGVIVGSVVYFQNKNNFKK